MQPAWLLKAVLLAIHAEQLAEHGGLPGIRDEARLDAALDRPKNLLAYDEPDIFDLAAAYAFGIAKGHPFVDGNKRTAFVAAELFLALNGHDLQAEDAECVMTWLALAEGSLPEQELTEQELAEQELAAWLRQRGGTQE